MSRPLRIEGNNQPHAEGTPECRLPIQSGRILVNTLAWPHPSHRTMSHRRALPRLAMRAGRRCMMAKTLDLCLKRPRRWHDGSRRARVLSAQARHLHRPEAAAWCSRSERWYPRWRRQRFQVQAQRLPAGVSLCIRAVVPPTSRPASMNRSGASGRCCSMPSAKALPFRRVRAPRCGPTTTSRASRVPCRNA